MKRSIKHTLESDHGYKDLGLLVTAFGFFSGSVVLSAASQSQREKGIRLVAIT